ncbi:MAG TPA: winged helix-turn-helix domain-containing protein [Candidatus Nitrosotalea sp.]|nr:winged helix-turn-helix domain-containing protein [Candidatus Nitrosotalea sp.]
MEHNEKTSPDVRDKIEILSTEDDKIKTIGELLSNESSRNMLKILLDDTMTANQIAQKIGISLPLAIYHLKKMQELGIVSVSTNQDDSKYYTSSKFAFIITSSKVSEKAKTSKSLFNSLKRIYRFASIGFGGLVSWVVLQSMQSIQNPSGIRAPVNTTTGSTISQSSAPTMAPALPAPANLAISPAVSSPPYLTPIEPTLQHDIWIIVIPLVVIIVGLVIERILRAYNK